MKIALVCDDLIQFGGAEKVFIEVAKAFPQATCYTSVATKEWINIFKKNNLKLVTSFMQKIPFSKKMNRYYSAFLLHILAMESFDFSNFDVVVSFSSRYAHHIVTKSTTKHICYMHSPGRMFWEPEAYFEKESYGFLNKLKKLGDWFIKFPISLIRILDYVAAQRVDRFIANSVSTHMKIKKYYHRESEVLYPFTSFELDKVEAKQGEYFLVITRLAYWKRVEVALIACEQLKLPLHIIGGGPAEKFLKSLSNGSTKFLGFASEEEKQRELSGCKAFIVTQCEDFGISPIEAMAYGKPVLAYGCGGALETVIAGKTGEFFMEQSAESLKETLRNFDVNKYSSEDCRKRSKIYDKNAYLEKLSALINEKVLVNESLSK